MHGRAPEIALTQDVQVVATVANPERKAGAFSRVLRAALPRLSDIDAVLIMDADGSLSLSLPRERPVDCGSRLVAIDGPKWLAVPERD